jgi:hypothetical protein
VQLQLQELHLLKHQLQFQLQLKLQQKLQPQFLLLNQAMLQNQVRVPLIFHLKI